MKNTIQIKILLEKKDYIKAFRSFYTRQFGNQIFIFFLLFLIIAGIISLVRNGMEPAIFLMVVFASIALMYPYFITPLIIGSKVEKNTSLLGESIWTFTDYEIIVKSESKESRLDWSALHEYIETKEYFLVIHSGNKRIFQIIPKRAFDTPEQEDRFRQLLRTKFGSDVSSFVVRHRRLFLFLIFIAAINFFVMYILGRNN